MIVAKPGNICYSRGILFEPFTIRWDKGSLQCISQEWNTSKASDAKVLVKIKKVRKLADKTYSHL